MRFRLFLVCAAATVVAPLVATPAAHAAPCVGTSRTYSGTIQGTDGRVVDVMLGFDAVDRYGRKLDARPGSSTYGCPFSGGYSHYIRLNPTVAATGATSGQKAWSVKLPANAVQLYVEAWSKGPGNTGDNQSRYANSLRTRIALPYPYSIRMALPLVCAAGGTTGRIHGWATKGGVRTKLDRAVAWSQAPDNNNLNPILGWNMGTGRDDGYYRIGNLQPNQVYVVRLTKNGVTKQFANVRVNPCANTYLGVAF
ncbi:MAG TPA: hypothetical protein VF519_01785 [Mycobacteriales bacterium]|jgi:hypothetical protein